MLTLGSASAAMRNLWAKVKCYLTHTLRYADTLLTGDRLCFAVGSKAKVPLSSNTSNQTAISLLPKRTNGTYTQNQPDIITQAGSTTSVRENSSTKRVPQNKKPLTGSQPIRGQGIPGIGTR
jgi:hypothetical protein